MPGRADLIEFYRDKHAGEAYGDTSVKYLRFLRPEIALLNPSSVIDYGQLPSSPRATIEHTPEGQGALRA